MTAGTNRIDLRDKRVLVVGRGPPAWGGGSGGGRRAEAVGPPAGGPRGCCVGEASSFQLETVETFRPRVAVLLNITDDPLDRYDGIGGYAAAKARIFRAQTAD